MAQKWKILGKVQGTLLSPLRLDHTRRNTGCRNRNFSIS